MKGKYRRYWKVPSSCSPGVFYTVTVMPNGQAECCCAAWLHGSREIGCWHTFLVAGLVGPSAELVARGATIRRARQGDFEAQVRLITARGVWLLNRNHVDAAEIAFQTLQKYVAAVKTHLPFHALVGITARRRTRDEVRVEPGKFWVR